MMLVISSNNSSPSGADSSKTRLQLEIRVVESSMKVVKSPRSASYSIRGCGNR